MKIVQPPPACSGCYLQNVKLKHIDFEVCYDGPILGGPGSIPYQVDDLILCEKCIENAAKLVGLKRHSKLIERIELLEAERAVLIEEAATQKAFADQLRGALALAPPEPVAA